MSKPTDERTTPEELFQELNKEFLFTLDAAASDENHKCPIYYTKKDSAFKHDWRGHTVFLNPPYSNLYRWVRKAWNECDQNMATVVMILPCDTSTLWFHDWLWDRQVHLPRRYVRLRFPKGRFKFGPLTGTPKFATIIAVLKNELGR